MRKGTLGVKNTFLQTVMQAAGDVMQEEQCLADMRDWIRAQMKEDPTKVVKCFGSFAPRIEITETDSFDGIPAQTRRVVLRAALAEATAAEEVEVATPKGSMPDASD